MCGGFIISHSIFFDVINSEDKGATLLDQISSFRNSVHTDSCYLIDIDAFNNVPGSPFSYWAPKSIQKLFSKFPSVESEIFHVRVGDHPGDGFRYLRLFWEISNHNNKLDWIAYQKGGEFSTYYYDIHLVVNWDLSRNTYRDFHGRPGRSCEHPSNHQYFNRPGLTWPRARVGGLCVRVLPKGCIFSDKGPCIFSRGNELDQLKKLLGIVNSKVFEYLIFLQSGSMTWEVGLVQKSPLPDLDNPICNKLGNYSIAIYHEKRILDTANELSHYFTIPQILQHLEMTILESYERWLRFYKQTHTKMMKIQAEIEKSIFELYGISNLDRYTIDAKIENKVNNIEKYGNIYTHVYRLLSFIIGVIFARWDIRISLNPVLSPDLPDPFEPYPISPPGMLIGPDDLPARSNNIVSEEWLRSRPDINTPPPEGSIEIPTIPDREYPISVSWDGILVNDSGHGDDIVKRIRGVIDIIWSEKAEAIEQEMCKILGVKNLSQYLNKTGNDGFWKNHVKHYTKSRRKAPVYWLLQSSNKNYSLWLYYHRLDNDIYFKVLRRIELKLKVEEGIMNELRKERSRSEGSELKRLENEIEAQQSFLNELHDFRDKLKRVTYLNLDPDLNDGVILNIAPLWELVPWKEPKKYWDELLAGKYDWSTISMQLKERGMI